MEKMTFENHDTNTLELINNFKESKTYSLVKKFKKLGIVGAFAISSLLASCGGGPKNEGTAQVIENNIENSHIEKISPEKIKLLQEKIDEYITATDYEKYSGVPYHNPRIFESPDGSTYIFHFGNPTDSTIEIKGGINDGPAKGEDVFVKEIYAEFVKKNGVLLKFSETNEKIDFNSDGNMKSEAIATYVVAEDGSIQSKGYKNGDFENLIDKAINSKKPSADKE